MFLAVSKTDDPTGDWWLYFFPETNGNDYPLLGFNKNWVVVTIVIGQRIYVFNRDSLYNGTLGTMNTFVDNTAMGFWGPAQTYDSAQATEYIIQNWNGNSGGYGYVKVSTITGTPDAPVYTAGTTIGIDKPLEVIIHLRDEVAGLKQ